MKVIERRKKKKPPR